MDFLDIVNASFYKSGLDIELTENAKLIINMLKDRNKTIFILIDGMGALVLNNLLPDSFLNKNVGQIATTIYPSTTSVVLTSLVTGKYPTTHAVNGWFNYIEETNESIIALPFVDRFDIKRELDVKFEDVFSYESRFNKMPCPVSVISKTDIIKSKYSKWFRGDSRVYAYRTLKGAFQILSKLVTKNNEKEFIYLYIDDFDSTCHKFGPDSEEAKKILNKLNEHIEKFARMHRNKINIVVTADHGQVTIKNENFVILKNEDEIIKLLKAPPTGDSRFVCFHVKEECKKQFEKIFCERYGEYAKLISQKELDESYILGKENMTEQAKRRFGDYCAIFEKEYAFCYIDKEINRNKLKKGCHSGTSEEEMKIPVIVIN